MSPDAFDRPVGDQEAVAVAMHAEAADGEFAAARGEHEMAALGLDQVAAGRQPVEQFLEPLAVVAARAEFPHQLLEGSPAVRQLADYLEQSAFGELRLCLGHNLIIRANAGWRQTVSTTLPNCSLSSTRWCAAATSLIG